MKLLSHVFVPNLTLNYYHTPRLFFFHHRTAYKASSYLEQVLARGAIDSQPSKELDEIYAKYMPPPLSAAQSQPPPPKGPSEDADSDASSTPSWEQDMNESERKLLLTRDAVPALTAALGLRADSSFASDVYRALEQARLRLEGASGASKSS